MAEDRKLLLSWPARFVGERVIARCLDDEDAAPMHEAIAASRETQLRPWLPWYNQHQTIEDTLAYVRRARGTYILRENFEMGLFARADGAFLGGVGVHPRHWQVPSFEIGYWLSASAQGHGYMSEAVRLLTSYLFDVLGAGRVMIRCDARNTRSRNVAERLGYVIEGTTRNGGIDNDGKPFDLLVLAMIPEDYWRAFWR